jgi:hypothetical protein
LKSGVILKLIIKRVQSATLLIKGGFQVAFSDIDSEFGISSGNPSDTGICEVSKGRKRKGIAQLNSKEPK